MSKNSISTQSLLELIGLFDRCGQPIGDGNGQRTYGIPSWEITAHTSLSPQLVAAWTDRVGYARHFPATRDDEEIAMELKEDDDPSRYSYRCPETFRVKYVAADDVAIHSVKAAKLLHAIAELMNIPQALRKGIDVSPVAGGLWHLGKARIGAAHTDVWLVRDLSTSIVDVFRHFSSPSMPDQGLILSSGMALPEFVRPPKNYRFASLRDVIVDYAPKPSIDMDLLNRILATPADGTLRPVLPVHFDEYTNTLTIRAKAKPWVIKGERQSAAVKYMFEQAINDRWVLAPDEILGAIYPDKKTARSQRMQNLFSGNAEWEDYIVNPEKGKYSFKLE